MLFVTLVALIEFRIEMPPRQACEANREVRWMFNTKDTTNSNNSETCSFCLVQCRRDITYAYRVSKL